MFDSRYSFVTIEVFVFYYVRNPAIVYSVGKIYFFVYGVNLLLVSIFPVTLLVC